MGMMWGGFDNRRTGLLEWAKLVCCFVCLLGICGVLWCVNFLLVLMVLLHLIEIGCGGGGGVLVGVVVWGCWLVWVWYI